MTSQLVSPPAAKKLATAVNAASKAAKGRTTAQQIKLANSARSIARDEEFKPTLVGE